MNSMEGDERRSRLTEAIDKVKTTFRRFLYFFFDIFFFLPNFCVKHERIAAQLGQCAERENELVLNIRQHEQDRDQSIKVVEDFKR